MKNKILIFCGFMILLIFIAFGTYFWYLYFLKTSSIYSSNSDDTMQVVGDISLIDNGNNVYDSDADNLDGDDVSSIEAYVFNVKNDSNSKKNYTLYIEDVNANKVKDGCTEDTLLKRSQLRYQLILDETVIKEEDFDNIKDNILDERQIEGNSVNHYKLRVYIKESADNWVGKHYHYKVTLKKNK